MSRIWVGYFIAILGHMAIEYGVNQLVVALALSALVASIDLSDFHRERRRREVD